jgi:diguanylate cyclase (GGDEF)-like protein
MNIRDTVIDAVLTPKTVRTVSDPALVSHVHEPHETLGWTSYWNMPVYLVSFAFLWVGMLGFLDYALSTSAQHGSMIAVPCAAALILCGAALFVAQTHVRWSGTLALLGFASSASCTLVGLTPFSSGHVHALDGVFVPDSGYWGIVLALLSLAIACGQRGRRGRQCARYLAAMAIGAAILLRLAPAWIQSGSYGAVDTANIAVLLVVMGGASVLALSRRWTPVNPLANKTVAVIAIAGSFVSVLGWYALAAQERSTTLRHAEIVSAGIEHRLQRSVLDQVGPISRMSRRWTQLGEVPSQTFVNEEFSSLLHDFGALYLVAVLDNERRIRWHAGRDAEGLPWLTQRLGTARYQGWLDAAVSSGRSRFSHVDNMTAPGLRSLVAAPIATPPMDGWLIVAVQDVSMLIAGAMSANVNALEFRIDQGERVLYGDRQHRGYGSYINQTMINLSDDVFWRLSSWHAEPWIQPLNGLVPDLVLLAGLLFTLLLIQAQQMLNAIRQHAARLHHGSLHDALTGLPNKKQLKIRLRQACRAARQNVQTVRVVLFDLDGIKLINDSMGRHIGDCVLHAAAHRIMDEVRGTATVARLDGVEFVAVFENASRDDAIGATKAIIASVARPYCVESMELRLTTNAGIAVSNGNEAMPMELVRHADLAMAFAKKEGCNTWYEYTADLSAIASGQLALRNELQKSLENHGFELHYQPLVDGYTGRIVGVEALLRWFHPERGQVPPTEFISEAEKTGQIIPMSFWVLDTAFRDISLLRSRHGADFPVMVNISPLHFQRSDFVSSIRERLLSYAVPAGCLEIEITEGVLLDNAAHTIRKLEELKELGVRISIDDFGTGYSSLNYLKNLPIDKIKIDRSFVNDVISDRHDAAITRAIIALAHLLNLKVVAEGVETESQFWFLKRNFCDEFQGYLFARPMSFSDFSLRLQEGGGIETLPVIHNDKESDRTLLLVDDEENILRALTRLLRRDGYRILTAKTPQEAFALLAAHDVQVIVSDQRMPDMTGTEFFSSVKEMYPRTVRLILSGYTDLKSVTDAINRGAIYKFLTKPWDDELLRGEIAQAFDGSRLRYG